MKFTKQKRFRKIVLLVFMEAVLGVEMQIGKKIGSVSGQLKQDGTCLAMEMGGPLNPYCKAGCLTWLRQPAGEAIR